MKNFMTKLISAAAALAMAASMSVYAEESVQPSTALSTGGKKFFRLTQGRVLIRQQQRQDLNMWIPKLPRTGLAERSV